MKKNFLTTIAVISSSFVLLQTSSIKAQEILGQVGQNPDANFEKDLIPFSATFSLNGGFDTNVTTSSSKEESAFVSAGLTFGQGLGSEATPVSYSISTSATHYIDDYEGRDEVEFNIGASLSIAHRFTPRLSISNVTSVTYGREPGFSPLYVDTQEYLASGNPSTGVGYSSGTVSRRSGDYFVGVNQTSLSYRFTDRVFASLSYAISGVFYDERTIADSEDRISHRPGASISYVYSPRTTYSLNYSPVFTDYDKADRDFVGHRFGLGINHKFNDYFNANLEIGATIGDSDVADSSTRPSLSLVVPFYINPRTNLAWVNDLGFDGAELGSFAYRYSYRTGLRLNYALTEKLGINSDVSFVWSDYLESVDGSSGVSETGLTASVGLNYLIFSNTSLNLGYTFATYNSDDSDREYDRHRIAGGVSVALF